ncbi:MAG: hypothetical protein ACU84H_11150 [Gammaproteobacteria bacterium]
MENSAITCPRFPPTRHLALRSIIALAMVFTFGNGFYADAAEDVKESSPRTKNSIYGQRYSQSILRGVKLSDVFTYNDTETTEFGPAYANVWTSPPNFLQCQPPTGRKVSYALCYYSGPDDPTGNNPDNPSLPCKLSPDGVVADCSCYEISTELVSPKIPYFVDINAISNLAIYQKTIDTCGKEGEKCAATDRVRPCAMRSTAINWFSALT